VQEYNYPFDETRKEEPYYDEELAAKLLRDRVFKIPQNPKELETVTRFYGKGVWTLCIQILLWNREILSEQNADEQIQRIIEYVGQEEWDTAVQRIVATERIEVLEDYVPNKKVDAEKRYETISKSVTEEWEIIVRKAAEAGVITEGKRLSFFKSTFDSKSDEWDKLLQGLVKDIFPEDTVDFKNKTKIKKNRERVSDYVWRFYLDQRIGEFDVHQRDSMLAAHKRICGSDGIGLWNEFIKAKETDSENPST
jgi:hypothetical protein